MINKDFARRSYRNYMHRYKTQQTEFYTIFSKDKDTRADFNIYFCFE